MADEQTAETLAPTEAPATPVNDGIVDLDAPVEAEENEDEEGKAKAAAEKTAEEEAETEKKKLSGAQRAKIREQRLRDELSVRERELEELRAKTPAAKASDSEEKAPKEEDFNGDWFSYQTAKSAYEARQAIRDELRKDRETRETSERESKQKEIVRERAIAHAERVEDAREVIADFDQAMKGMDGVQARTEVIEEIMASDKSALIAYHLAKNPSKLEALNSMSGRELAREMGRLEATVKMPEAKKQTSAPAPMSRPKGGAAPPSQDAELAAYLKKTYGDRAH
jgi:multidrug efflux pump subunit AcrA (membrane-fusion protein)